MHWEDLITFAYRPSMTVGATTGESREVVSAMKTQDSDAVGSDTSADAPNARNYFISSEISEK